MRSAVSHASSTYDYTALGGGQLGNAAARAGRMADVVGIDIPFPTPEQADLVIRNDGPSLDAANIAVDILARITACSEGGAS